MFISDCVRGELSRHSCILFTRKLSPALLKKEPAGASAPGRSPIVPEKLGDLGAHALEAAPNPVLRRLVDDACGVDPANAAAALWLRAAFLGGPQLSQLQMQAPAEPHVPCNVRRLARTSPASATRVHQSKARACSWTMLSSLSGPRLDDAAAAAAGRGCAESQPLLAGLARACPGTLVLLAD